jgi:hypothetical protein
LFRRTPQFDQRGVADRFDDVTISIHVHEFLSVCCQMQQRP